MSYKEEKEYKFSEILSTPLRNGVNKPTKIRGTGYKMVNMGELFANPIIRNMEMARVPMTDSELKNSLLHTGDLLFARQSLTIEGAGKCSLFLGNDDLYTFEGHLIRARVNEEIASPKYVYYYFNSFIGKSKIKTLVDVTAAAGIRSSDLGNLKINLPPAPAQYRIADIIFALDEKIELNRQTNVTLGAIVQALFKEWFVDFNFPTAKGEMIESELGMIPNGWKITAFEDELEAERGLSYKGAGLETENAMPMHNLNSVYEGGGYKFNGIKYYSGEYKEKHIVRPGDLIVANTEQGHKYLLIGYPAIVPSTFGEIGIYSHHIYCLRPKPHSYLTTDFVYQLLLQSEIREQVIGFANGTTVNMLKIEGLRKPKFVLPPKELVVQFSELARSVRLRHEENINQSTTLAAVRDTLLPRLMSGEVSVKG